MARIANTNIPDTKNIEISLTYVYGIGRHKSSEICKLLGINPFAKTKDMTEEQMNKIREYIAKNETVEGDLRRQIQNDIRRLKDINCYRGTRHKKGLPCRGQKTRKNSRTRKGKRKTIANKKIESK